MASLFCFFAASTNRSGTGAPEASSNVNVPSSPMPHFIENVVVAALAAGGRSGASLVSLVREYSPLPGIPVLRNVPRLPTPTDAPRGPNVKLEPEPLRFHRMPGASFMDLRNRSATPWILDACEPSCDVTNPKVGRPASYPRVSVSTRACGFKSDGPSDARSATTTCTPRPLRT